MFRVPTLIIALSLAACSTARIDQFQQFAETGIAYAGAVDRVTLEAAGAAIDADSAVLARTRAALPAAERARTVLDHDELLRERLDVLGDLQRHAGLLRDYFLMLAALAESDTPRGAVDRAEDLVAAIEALGERLGAARFGGETIGPIAVGIAEISVAHFQRRLLERELKARAAFIARELDLQEAAMEAIAEGLRVDLEVVTDARRLTDVVDPYRAGGTLPRAWAKRRREVLTATEAAKSAQAAMAAAASLRRSFEALLANRYTVSDYQAVMADVDRIAALIERLESE